MWHYMCFKNNPKFRNSSYFFYCFVVFLSGMSSTLEPMFLSPTLCLAFEFFLTIVFTAEFIVRLYISPDMNKYITSPMGLLDIIAMSSSITYLIVLYTCTCFLKRFFKFSLVFRILKCTRICRGVLDICHVIWACKEYIGLFLGTALSCCVITAAHVHHVEEHLIYLQSNGTEIHYFGWLWYSVITVTGVGYGDYIPSTVPGKVFGGLLAVIGVVVFSMCATQLVYKFVFVYYLPDVLMYDKRDEKMMLITIIRNEFLEDMDMRGIV